MSLRPLALSCGLLVGCGSTPALPPLAPPPVDVEVDVAHTVVESGAPVEVDVTVWASDGWALSPATPVAEGLRVVERSVDGPVVVGDRTRTTTTWELTGADGPYVVVVPPVEARGPGDQSRTLEPAPVFVDIGTPPPALDGLVDVEAIPEAAEPPVAWIVAGGTVGVLGLGLVAVALVLVARSKPAPRPEPAEVVARTAWSAARRDVADDHALALALSQIFRRFLQAVTGFPTLSRTTRELVTFLETEDLLDAELRQRSRRVLDATDRLKFAREGGGDAFFDALEQDFLAVVDALSGPRPLGGTDA